MNENAIDRNLVCAFIGGLISDDAEREKGLEYISNMPPVNPQPCEDAISRQAVIDSLHSKFADGFDSDRWWNSMSVLYAINKVPPVNPTKTGHWIVHEKPHGIRFLECPYCNTWYLNEHLIRNSYCPNCGCRMVEPQESEDKTK